MYENLSKVCQERGDLINKIVNFEKLENKNIGYEGTCSRID